MAGKGEHSKTTGVKRPVRRKGSKELSVRARKAIDIYVRQCPGISKEAATIKAGYARGHGSRVIKLDELPRQMLRALLQEHAVTPAEITRPIARLLRKRKPTGLIKRPPGDKQGDFLTAMYDADGNPKRGFPFSEPDLEANTMGTKLSIELIKAGADGEYGKKMYEQGLQQSNTYWVGVLGKLQLTPEQQAVLDGEAAQAKQGDEASGKG